MLINGSATASNQVLGNIIGVNLAGSGALGNGINGVLIEGPGTIVGGSAAGAGNLISANGSFGVMIFGASAAGNRV